MTKMNPDVKARWVAALRSGEYKQGKGALQEDGAFCCLGVLCDLHSKETGCEWESEGIYGGESNVPPPSVARWAGMKYANDYVNPRLAIGGVTAYVAVHNDQGRTFAEIADAIEAQL